jgi:hypothetical protein
MLFRGQDTSECRFFGKVNGALSFATRRENMIPVVMKSPRQAKASGGRSMIEKPQESQTKHHRRKQMSNVKIRPKAHRVSDGHRREMRLRQAQTSHYVAMFFTGLVCGLCGKWHSGELLQTVCQDCGRPLLAQYDLSAASAALHKEKLDAREPCLWRYREMLPLSLDREPINARRRLDPFASCASFWRKNRPATSLD